jgi:flavin-dependent dehydrogenase
VAPPVRIARRSVTALPSAGPLYDVAIAGGSFAGLAVALSLRGRVAVIDPQPIGEGQTSACGTTLAALRVLDALDTVQQVHEELVLHLAPASRDGGAERVLVYPLPYPYCTFDYGALCRKLAARAQARGVEIVPARATGWRDGALQTDRGPVRARHVVDATGWRAVVARSLDPAYVRRDRLSCGLEAELPQPAGRQARGLHFWAGHSLVWPGYAWSFPAGRVARLGVIAYAQSAQTVQGGQLESSSKGLRELLDAFLDGPAAPYWSPDGEAAWQPGAGKPTAGRHLHGGFLPAAPRRPVMGPIFVVGDAAGQCFGLTGEGIRPALAFALRCGQLLQQAIDGACTPEQARRAYARYVALRMPYLWLMWWLQRMVSRLTDRGLGRYSAWAHPRLVFRFLMGQYLWPADPARAALAAMHRQDRPAAEIDAGRSTKDRGPGA